MDVVDRVRAFGRFYTTRTGLHARSFMGSPLGFSEARLLHDLLEGGEDGHGDGPTARDLARGLGLDEGYVSRTLAAFARAGWLDRVPDGADARRRRLRLTPAGRAVAEDLCGRSRAAVALLLDPLPDACRQEAAQMLDRARALLEGGRSPAPDEGAGRRGRQQREAVSGVKAARRTVAFVRPEHHAPVARLPRPSDRLVQHALAQAHAASPRLDQHEAQAAG